MSAEPFADRETGGERGASGLSDAARIPTGQVTFLFTDVEGSSALWEEYGDSMSDALAEHDRRLRTAIDTNNGYVFTTAGDSFAVAFNLAAEALDAAVAAQLHLREPAPGPRMRVRMGLHTGSAVERDGDYFGPVLNRCARLMSAGHGGQVLVSEATAALVRQQLPAELELADLGEHRLKDLAEPEHMYQVVHARLPHHFPPPRTVDVISRRLPAQLSSFIGRHDDLTAVGELVDNGRLVTLAGPGGAGKTRLALEIARERLDQYPGGVGIVELAPIVDPELVAETVAEVFGARATPDGSVVDAIEARIEGRRILIIIDNCEHVIEATADLLEGLLRSCPDLTILATSQTQLGIAGEVLYRVPSLAIPDHAVDAHQATGFDAVRLFEDRASLAKPSFELTAQNVEAVVAVCRRLDGIPLALELAAARVKVLAPEQILQRLDERFRLLAKAPRNAESRHQTLQAAIDWSHDLLDESEKALLRRAATFAGDFGLEAAERVCAGEPIDEYDVLDLLSALVDKSLVAVEDSDAETRFRLLESMRQYALARLAESPDLDMTRLGHLAFFADSAEHLQVTYRGGDLASALDALRNDRDNVRAALEYGITHGHVELAARIVGAVGYLWYAQGAFREGIDWCTRLFALDPELAPPLMASVLHSYGTLAGSWSEPAKSAEILEREVAIRRRLDEPVRLAAALNNLGNLWNDAGRRDLGDAALRESVAIYRAAGESPSKPISGLAYSAMHAGEYDLAETHYLESFAEASTADDTYDLALTTAALGVCALHRGRLDDSRTLLEEGRERYAELGVTPGVQDADLHLAVAHRAKGDGAAAADRLLAFLEQPDAHWYAAGKYWALQIAASLMADPGLAAELLGCVDSYYESIDEPQSVFITGDLDRTRQRLMSDLGDGFDLRYRAGLRRSIGDVITTVRSQLAAIADGSSDASIAG